MVLGRETTRVNLKMRAFEKRLVQRVAKLEGISLSEFMRSCALEYIDRNYLAQIAPLEEGTDPEDEDDDK